MPHHKAKKNVLTRRSVLKGLGSSVALPMLAATRPSQAHPQASGHRTGLAIPGDLVTALRQAYAEFNARATAKERQVVWQVMQSSHDRLNACLRAARAEIHPVTGQKVYRTPYSPIHPEMALMFSALTGARIDLGPAAGRDQVVSPDGVIMGPGKYQTLDPGWVTAATTWLQYFHDKVSWPTTAIPRITIPNNTRIALVGDWGTGFWRDASNPAPAEKVAQAMRAQNPDYSIHLGDVYYSGLPVDNLTHFKPSEGPNFTSVWPGARLGNFALNSNHDMYPGGVGYFDEALTDELFALQKGSSCFWLENDHWVIIGLDSAYFSSSLTLYGDGELDTVLQIPILEEAAQTGKRVMLLSHHNGLDQDGGGKLNIWFQVQAAVAGTPTWWYWGHVHAGAVYTTQQNIRPRCSGHGGIPWGESSSLANSSQVVWYESDSAQDPDISVRVVCGFTMITLNGASITETFIDENNKAKWSLVTP